MRDATERVNMVPASDRPRAFAAIGKAVWWINIVRDSGTYLDDWMEAHLAEIKLACRSRLVKLRAA
jgi:hypothetical protein